jgi:hypothetical protein
MKGGLSAVGVSVKTCRTLKMGYTHYWYRPKKVKKEIFSEIVKDFKRMLPALEKAGVALAGPLGKGDPVISNEKIVFNGNANCGHPVGAEFAVTWPSKDAGGVMSGGKVGTWLAGAVIDSRICNGDCSHETFEFKRKYKPPKWQEPDKNGLFFDFCKTAFKPYDLAVTAALIIIKHHLGSSVIVRSDGGYPQWFDALLLCQMELGYGMQYEMHNSELRVRFKQRETKASIRYIKKDR